MAILSLTGLVILVIGVFLIGCGVKKTQTLTNKVVEGVTGHYTKYTLWYLFGGVVIILIGIILIYIGWQPSAITHP